MRKTEAMALRAEARKKAEEIMDEIIPVAVPGSDDEKAKAALTELCTIGLAPGDVKMKVAALGKVLEYTKAKPAQKQDVRINNAEAWLAEAIADAKSS
jgi:myo-inositol catabolism protein IolC